MKINRRIIAVTSVVALIGGLSIPAAAAEQQPANLFAALQAVSQMGVGASQRPLEGRASKTALVVGNEGLNFDDGSTRISVASSAKEGIQIQSKKGDFTIGLPFASDASGGFSIDDGLMAFDNGNGSYTVPVIKADGSLAITSIISSSASENQFTYRFTLPKGSRMVQDSRTGSVDVLSAGGQWLGGVAAPWAKDARGADVPTHFSVRGSNLIQVVDSTSKNFAFPIVADPWFGVNLIQKTVWASNLWKWSPTLMVYPTDYGRYYASTLAVAAAWAETLDKTSRVGYPNPDTETMQVQFNCHYIFVRVRESTKSSWNLDSKLPSTDLLTEANYGCNYPVGDPALGF
jgi:hypothetical protein